MSRTIRASFLASLALLLGSLLGHAETLHVPEEYPTIQAAIDAVSFIDSISVAAGTYAENLVFDQPAVLFCEERAQLVAEDPSKPAILILPTAISVFVDSLEILDGTRGVVVLGDATARLYHCVISGFSVGVEVFGEATAVLLECTVQENETGVIVGGEGTLVSTGSRISHNTHGIDIYAPACGYSRNEDFTFRGEIQGQDNDISGNALYDLCPSYPGPTWPKSFLVADGGMVEDNREKADLLFFAAGTYYLMEKWEAALFLLAEAAHRFQVATFLPGEAASHFTAGLCRHAMEQWRDAIEEYGMALVLYDKMGSTTEASETRHNLHLCLVALHQEATALYSVGNYEEALQHYVETAQLSALYSDQSVRGRSLTGRGLCEESLGFLMESVTSFLDAADAFESSEEPEDRANTLLGATRSLNLLHRYREAFEHGSEALGLYREHGPVIGELAALSETAASAMGLGEFQTAANHYDEWFAHPSAPLLPLEMRAACALGLAFALEQLSQQAKALGWFSQAVSLFETLGKSEEAATAAYQLSHCALSLRRSVEAWDASEIALSLLAKLPPTDDNLLVKAGVLNNQGIAGRNLNRFDIALESYADALEVYAQLDTDEARAGEAKVLLNIGVCWVALGEPERALQHYMDSLRISESIGDEAGVDSVLTNLAIHLGMLGEYDQALLLLFDRLIDVGTSGDMTSQNAQLLHNIGLAQLLNGDLSEAHETLSRVLAFYESTQDHRSAASCLHLLGECALALGDHTKAASHLAEAMRTLEHLDSLSDQDHTAPDLLWKIDRSYAQLSRATGEADEAVASLWRAVGVIESIRADLQGESFRSLYFVTVREVYEELLSLLCMERKGVDGLLVSERCHARTFLDAVAAGPVDSLDNIAEEGIRTGSVDASVIESDLAEVVAGLPANTAAIEYFVTEEVTYLWLIRDGSAGNPIQIEIARSDLLEQVLEFRTAIETTSTGLMDVPDEDTLAMSRDLYELLIASVVDQLEGIDHLVIVPSGPLYYLPFCALVDCPDCEGVDLLGGEYLVERYALSYAPSLTTLKYAWASSDATSSNPLFLALADPDSGDPELPRLPDAQDEAATVSELFEPSEVYVGSAATEDVVASRASSADHVLLATHGVFNPLNPMFSYLLLAPTAGSDGRLYTHEIFSLDLHTDLVTLSACETLLPALGDAEVQGRAIRGMSDEEPFELDESLLETLTAGDEIVGLTRAFIYAGTPSVLSSLWRVVSETTEALMVTFYGYLQQGFDKAQALRQAQLDVMASYPHPRYWAAFELVGDWR